jgi:hypothetical protein
MAMAPDRPLSADILYPERSSTTTLECSTTTRHIQPPHTIQQTLLRC